MNTLLQYYYLILQRQRLLLIPMITLPILSMIVLLFVQPAYHTQMKIWAKEKQEESMLLRIERKGLQEDTFAQVQSEIIRSNRVFRDVVEKLRLYEPLPSQSLFSRFLRTFWNPKPKIRAPKESEVVKAIQDLYNAVTVKVLNPEVIQLSVQMNTPELAQAVAKSVVEAYRTIYLELLNHEINDYESFLKIRLGQLDKNLRDHLDLILEFENQNPLIVSRSRKLEENPIQPLGPMMTPSYAKTVGDSTPIPLLLNIIADLEFEKNRVELSAGDESHRLRKIVEEIQTNRVLLDRYMLTLSNQAKLEALYEMLKWQVTQARSRFEYAQKENDKLVVARGTKMQQTGSITILDYANFDNKPIYPKKKLTLLLSLFLGMLLGLSLIYLSITLNRSFYFPEDVQTYTGLPLISIVDNK